VRPCLRVQASPTLADRGGVGGNYSLSFFSDSRMSALAACLQNSKVNDLVGRVAEVINARLQSSPQSPNGSILRRAENIEAAMDQNVASVYVKGMHLSLPGPSLNPSGH